jgi:hypothetical protein
MSIISREFLQKIAKDRLDDFFYNREEYNDSDHLKTSDLNELKMLKIKSINFVEDHEYIYDNISYTYLDKKIKMITESQDDYAFFVNIDKIEYVFYFIEDDNSDVVYYGEREFTKYNTYFGKYYIKRNSKYYKCLHQYEYYMIFTCIAILFSKPDYLDIFDEIIGVKFNRRIDIYRPAIYHILDGYLSEKVDGFTSFEIDNYLIYTLQDKKIHMIDEINDNNKKDTKTIHFINDIFAYELDGNIFTVFDSIKYKNQFGLIEFCKIPILQLEFFTLQFIVKPRLKNGKSYIFTSNIKTSCGCHAISVVIYCTKNEENKDIYQIFIVNSGYDMDSLTNYTEIEKNDLKYCRPFSCYKTDDIKIIGKLST